MNLIIDFFSNPIVLFSFLVIVSLAILTVVHFKINVAGMAKEVADDLITKRLRIDKEKTRKREQLSKLGKKENIYVLKYRMAVSSIKIALNVNFLSVENFTSIFMLFGLLVWGVLSFFLNNIFLGFLVVIPAMMAFLAFLLVITKKRIRANDNVVMDALDAICPTIDIGVDNSIRANMSSYDKRIKHHFEWYLAAREFQGYLLPDAMDELARRLGPRFNDFAEKAKLYDEHYRAGMEDIFKDIIESNNDARSDNMELDEMFEKRNADLLMTAGLLVGFLTYMLFVPLSSEFMLGTFWGKLVISIEISMLVLIYAITQLLQVDIPDIDEEKMEK